MSRANRQHTNPIETKILREGLRIADVHPYKELDLLAIVLYSGDVLQARISDFARLNKASEQWRLIGDDIGINWDALDEDLSVREFIRDAARQEALRRLGPVRRRKVGSVRLERISEMPFGLREGLSRPCVVVEALTEYPTMLGFEASPEREIPLARCQKQF